MVLLQVYGGGGCGGGGGGGGGVVVGGRGSGPSLPSYYKGQEQHLYWQDR